MGRRVVVKIGSSSLTSEEGGIDRERIAFFAGEIARLQQAGHEPILVTSGAVAAGFREIGYARRPKALHEKQASAAVGQAILMQAYYEAFGRFGRGVAQILLTRSDFSQRKRIGNALRTLDELVSHGIVPIINENDTVSVDELKFGDNDTLSALVANLVRADRLVIITDMDGLYTADPRKDAHAERISHVKRIDEQIFRYAGGAGSEVGTGGMRSKIEAARIAVRGGVAVFIGRVEDPGDLELVLEERGKGTYFDAGLETLPIKKQWVGFYSDPKGRIFVDRGAEEALSIGGKSLLPAGVTGVDGDFHPGDVVEVVGPDGAVIGRGVVNYAAWQLRAAAGFSSAEVEKRLDVQRIEVIHRDDWVDLSMGRSVSK
jgi:glutamate 5-kinase